MTDARNMDRNVTATDIALASALYPILVERAAAGVTITYGELAEQAKRHSPGDELVVALIPISVGRRLDVVRMFTDASGLPDLSSIVVNAHTGEVGSAYSDLYDPTKRRAQVFAYDWAAAEPGFRLHVEATSARATASLQRISRAEAKQLMAKFAGGNRRRLAKNAPHVRERIIELLIDGHLAEDAFRVAGAMDPDSPGGPMP